MLDSASSFAQQSTKHHYTNSPHPNVHKKQHNLFPYTYSQYWKSVLIVCNQMWERRKKVDLAPVAFCNYYSKTLHKQKQYKNQNFPICYPLQQHKDWKKMSALWKPMYMAYRDQDRLVKADLKQSHYYG